MNPTVGMLVAFAVAGLLVAGGRPVATAAALIAMTVGGQFLEFRPRWKAMVATGATRLGHAVGWVLLTIMELVVFLPVWLVARALRWDLLDPRDTTSSRWLRHERARVSAKREFARDRRSLAWPTRLHGAAVGLVLLALVGAGGVAVVRRQSAETAPRAATVVEQAANGAVRPADPEGLLHSLIAHAGDPWAADLFREEAEMRNRYDPYLTFRPTDVEGDLINITDRRRRSYTATDPGDDPLVVWFFGSSALFGIGQRDEHTIPSEIVRLAEDDDIAVRAENFGMSAYVNWQETLLFAQLLTEREPPDLVVFYDGANDVGAYAQVSEPPEPTTLFVDQVSAALADADLATAEVRSGPASPRRFAPVYYGGVRIADDLGAANGIDVLHFFQPSFGTKQLTEFDQPLLDELGWDAARFDAEARSWDEVEDELGPPVIPLFDALDDAPEPVYMDQVHTDEVGARIVAEALYEHLRPALEAQRG